MGLASTLVQDGLIIKVQNVGQLDVPVDQPLGVQHLDRPQQPPSDRNALVDREFATPLPFSVQRAGRVPLAISVTPPVVRPGYLRKADAAKDLSVSIRTLTEWMQHRVVPYIKLSHRVCLFKQTDLDTAMARFRTAAIGE